MAPSSLLLRALERAPAACVLLRGEALAPNVAACRLVGRTPAALATRAAWFEAAHPHDPEAAGLYARARDGAQATTVVRSDGRSVPVRVVAAQVDGGEVWWLEDLRAEVERDEIWRVLFDEAPEPHSLVGQGGFHRVNRALAERLGFSTPSELLLRRPAEFAPPVQSDGRPTREAAIAFERSILAKGVDRAMFRHQNVQGEPLDIEVTGVVVDLARGSLIHTVWRDLTDVHRQRDALEAAASELRAARLAAERAGAAKTRFLANVSHELRTPLNGILGMTSLLLAEEDLEATHREHLLVVQASAEALLQILNDVLDFSKLEAGKLEAERGAVDLEALGRAVVTAAQRGALRRGLELVFDYSPTLARRFHGDAQRIRQVLDNLVSNALKFTARGRVELRIGPAGPPGQVAIAVRDTGIGIAPEHLERIFEAFEQADATSTRRFGGAGLGLAISRRLTALMGGALTVESVVGQGSVFTLRLPLDPLGESEDGGEERPGRAGWRPLARPVHALLAEDNPVNELVANRLLACLGVSIDVARNGREAVGHGLTRRHDLILMDLQMPEMSGLAATRHLRAAGVDCPIVAMTANAASDDEAECIDAGMNAHLTKPVTLQRLYQVLARLGFS